jgi:hypothetical protein
VSQATLEKKTSVDAGSDLASLVIAYHRENHGDWADVDPKLCPYDMCPVAAQCLDLDASFFGTDA